MKACQSRILNDLNYLKCVIPNEHNEAYKRNKSYTSMCLLIKKVIKYDFNDRGFRNMLQNGRNESNFLTKEPIAFNLCYQSKWRHHYNPLLRDHCASPERQLNCHTVHCIVYL